ncbi:MAG: winged helix-turn-helix domain-containing protein [Niveispirillum sp.]|uniref:winged helix-turn-helix domain-containing protein n=1 Tax=Niveispirillum sp. TaxID=1917217 RepID=UPI003BA7A824
MDGVVRRRRTDPAAKVRTEFGVTLAERPMGEMLRRLGFRRLSARPQYPSHVAPKPRARMRPPGA